MINRIICMLVLVLIAVSVQAKTVKTPVRGAWVTAWTDGFFSVQQVDDTLAAAKRSNINTLFIQVRKNADAYYFSDIEKPGNGLTEGFDPLDDIIPKAHKMGIKVHAWINVYRVWTAPSLPSDPDHVMNKHPEWINVKYSGETRSSDGSYLDPGNPEARRYIVSIVSDIVSRYKVDGIHLDYIRYPGNEWGYSKAAISEWQRATKRTDVPGPWDTSWSDWRRIQVTTLVKNVYVAVKKISPKTQVTAAVICWGDPKLDFKDTRAYQDALQDWRKWTSAGYVDAIAPMNYASQKKSKDRFCNWISAFNAWKLKRPVYVGLYTVVNSPADILAQARITEKAKLGGWVLFSFNRTDQRDQLVKVFNK